VVQTIAALVVVSAIWAPLLLPIARTRLLRQTAPAA
jgi:hypothetical protein